MRILKWAILALVLLIGAVVVALLTVDVNRFKPEIIAAVEQATGRKLAVAGDLKVKLYPSIGVAVKGVTFANAEWGSRPVMASIGEFLADVDLFALLGQKIKIDRLILADIDLLIEKDRRGRGNWEFGTMPAPAAGVPKAAAPASGSEAGFRGLPAISNVTLRNVKLAFRDAQAGLSHDASITELTVKAGKAGALAAHLSAGLDGTPLVVDGTFGSLEEMMAPSRPWPVKLAISLPAADLKANVEGSIAEPMIGKGYAIKLALEAPDISRVAKLAKQTVPNLGPLNLVATIREEGGEPSIPEMRLTLGSEAVGRLNVGGAVRQPLAQKGLNLDVDFATPDAKKFAAQFGAQVAQAVPVKVKLNVKDAAALRYAISGIAAEIAGSDLRGAGEVNISGKRPAVRFDLASTFLNLLPLLGDEPAAATPAAKAATPTGGGGAQGNRKVFSDAPLPLEGLKAVDAELRYKADRFQAPKLQAQGVNVAIALKDGALSIRPLALGVGGGTVNGDVALNANSGALVLKLDARGFGLSDYLKAEKITDVVTRDAKTDVMADLSSQGLSLHALMAGLNGRLVVKVGEGELREQYLDFLGGDVLGMLGKLGQVNARTKLECVVAGFDVKAGVATPKALLVETGRIAIAGEGKIDLGQEVLALKLVPVARDAVMSAAAIPINVTGPLSDPSVSPEAGAIVKGVVGAVAGTALLGPAAILGSLLGSGGSGGTAERGQAACARATALAEGRTPPPSTAPKTEASPQAPPAKSAPATDALKGLGNLFKR